jgi:hypothetical protein
MGYETWGIFAPRPRFAAIDTTVCHVRMQGNAYELREASINQIQQHDRFEKQQRGQQTFRTHLTMTAAKTAHHYSFLLRRNHLKSRYNHSPLPREE